MKTKLGIGILLLATLTTFAQTNNLTSLLQQGLFEEQANRNLDAAIADYQSLATQFDKDRKIAATAIFRLGECYRALGKTNEAAAQYQLILKNFSDQATLATLSRQNLAGMGIKNPDTTPAESPDIALWNKVKSLPANELPSTLPTLVSDPVLDSLLQQRNETAAKLAQLKVDYAPDNLNVVRQQTALDEINRRLDQKVSGIMLALKMRAEIPPSAQPSKQADFLEVSVPRTSEEDEEIQRIQQIIKTSPDLINKYDKSGDTMLSKAAVKGQTKVVNYLLDHGAEVDAGFPALSQAARSGNLAMVELLLKRGANVNLPAEYGRTALTQAAQEGFVSIVKVLLEHKADPNATDSRNGETPLFLSVYNGHEKCARLLLEAGAKVNAETSGGRNLLTDDQTPLSIASERGDLEMMKLLLAAKADPNAGKKNPPLLGAIASKNLDAARLLLQAGANPNAAGKGVFPNITADANYLNHHDNMTPLWLAVYLHQPAMVQLLLKFKADPNDSQTDGRPLLFNALSETNILETLLDAGANVDVRDATDKLGNNQVLGRTPLLIAIAHDLPANTVEILLKHGANPNARDKAFGQTSLHWISGWGGGRLPDRKIVELLLDYKADPNARNDGGRTPLDLLKTQERSGNLSPQQKNSLGQIIDLLRQHGALDILPDWNSITVSRPSANYSAKVFRQGTNDWNHFTLLETILNFYYSNGEMSNDKNYEAQLRPIIAVQNSKLPFPNLAHVTIVRPQHDSTNVTRIEINLLNDTNGIDCSKDVPLRFGDVVEIPEYDHALGDRPVGLTDARTVTIEKYLSGNVTLVAHGDKVKIPFAAYGKYAKIGFILNKKEAQAVLLSSSDLSRVKVIRNNPQTGKQQAWVFDCSNHNETPDFWLRDGDVIEVPEKP